MPKILFITVLIFFLFTPLNAVAGEMEDYGILDVKNHQISSLPKLKGDGTTDETAKIQQLADYAYKNRLALIFPQGDYLVSNTIELTQIDQSTKRKDTGNVWFGSTKGSRPTIVLKSNSNGFNNQNNPKPIISITATCVPGTRSCPYPDNDRASNFQQGLKNFNIEIKDKNAGAVGISFPGSQDSFLEDITINVGSGLAGMGSTPGLGVVTTNIEIIGGKYGIYLYEPIPSTNNGTTFTDLKLINQTDYAIKSLRPSEKPVSFAGVLIEKNSAPVLHHTGGGDSAQFVFIDTYIDLAKSTNNPVIENNGSANVSFFNTYVKNGPNFIKNGNTATAGSGQNYLVKEYSYVNSHSRYVENGSAKNGVKELKSFGTSELDKNQLLTRHSFCKQELSMDHLIELSKQNDSGICNVVSGGANPKGDTVSSNQIQSLINNSSCSTVILPKGEYWLDKTLEVKRGLTITGLASHLTRIRGNKAIPNGISYSTANVMDKWKPTSNEALIKFDTVDQPVFFSFIRLQIPMAPENNAWFSNLHWVSGKNYIIKDISVRSMFNNSKRKPTSDVLISGDVSGKWFGTKAAGSGGESKTNTHADKRKMTVQNSSGPLALYNLNIEDGWAHYANRQTGGQMDVKNSQNFVIYGAKAEDKRPFRYYNVKNGAAFALGKSEMEIYNSSNILVSNFDFFKHSYFREDDNIITNADDRNGPTVPSLGYFKRGNFDLDSYNNKLDQVCAAYSSSNPTPTPDNTSTPTPTTTPKYDSKYDLNTDGKVTIMDIIELIKYVFQ
jgi:hypothetical protein